MNITPLVIERKINNHEEVLYPTLIEVEGKHYLVDCGYEDTFDAFVNALRHEGRTIKDLHAIIISHDDIDHLEALHLFKAQHKDILVYCSAIEEKSVSGKIKSERLEQAENSLAHLPEEHKPWALNFIEQLRNIKRIDVNYTVNDNDTIENEIVVIATPGHTKGHISLYLPSLNMVIANDAIVVEGDALNIANPMFTLDMPQAVASVEKIKGLKPEILICYHGGVMRTDLDNKLENLMVRYKKS